MWSDFEPTSDGIIVTLPPTKTCRVAIGKVQGIDHRSGCSCERSGSVGMSALGLNGDGDISGARLDEYGRLESLDCVCPVALFHNAQLRVANFLEIEPSIIPPNLPMEATFWSLADIPAGMNVVKAETGSVFDDVAWQSRPVNIITAVSDASLRLVCERRCVPVP